jgi:hypothetical protein
VIVAALKFHNGEREDLGVRNVEEIDNEIQVHWYDNGDEWEPTTQTEEHGVTEIGENLPDPEYTQALPREYERVASERDLEIE